MLHLTIGDYAGQPLLTLSECRAHLRIDGHDFDAEVAGYLAAAQRAASREAGTLFGSATCVAVYESFPPAYGKDSPDGPSSRYPLSLPYPSLPIVLGTRPVTAVASVEYFDGALWQAVDPLTYRVTAQTGRVIPLGRWPASVGPESVRVTFTAGTAAAPVEARQAILIILAHYFENRGDQETKSDLPKAALRLLWQLHDGRVVG